MDDCNVSNINPDVTNDFGSKSANDLSAVKLLDKPYDNSIRTEVVNEAKVNPL